MNITINDLIDNKSYAFNKSCPLLTNLIFEERDMGFPSFVVCNKKEKYLALLYINDIVYPSIVYDYKIIESNPTLFSNATFGVIYHSLVSYAHMRRHRPLVELFYSV